MLPVFLTFPHSGEHVPEEVTWLDNIDEAILMRDVDRYVDQLYAPVIDDLKLPFVKAEIHRYVVDLNRAAGDIDPSIVADAPDNTIPSKFVSGIHWRETTRGEKLMDEPMSMDLHKELIQKYFDPFHAQVQAQFSGFFSKGHKKVYHIDCHSMPSEGTKKHPDPGETRAEIVISDREGLSCDPDFKNAVVRSFKEVGFNVAYNWPYVGGRITETYGAPEKGQNTIQVEISRALYMNEDTRAWLPKEGEQLKTKLTRAIHRLMDQMSELEEVG